MPTSHNRRKKAKKHSAKSASFSASLNDFNKMGQMVTQMIHLEETNVDGVNENELAAWEDQVKNLALPYLGRGVWDNFCVKAEKTGALSPFLVRELHNVLQVALGLDSGSDGETFHLSALMGFGVVGSPGDIEKLTTDAMLPLLREVWGDEISIRMPSRFLHPGVVGARGLDGLVEIREGLSHDSSELIESLVAQSALVAQKTSPNGNGLMLGLFPFSINCTGSIENQATQDQLFWRAYEASETDRQHLFRLLSERFPGLIWSNHESFVYAMEDALDTFLLTQGSYLASHHGMTNCLDDLEVVDVKFASPHYFNFNFECRGQAIGHGQLNSFELRLASPDWVKDHVDEMMDPEEHVSLLG